MRRNVFSEDINKVLSTKTFYNNSSLFDNATSNSLQDGCTHLIKRHQNALSKKVADHFQGFCIELNRSDIVFANQMDRSDS